MKSSRKQWRGPIALAAAALLVVSVAVRAGPNEDYNAGAEAYRTGDMVAAINTLKKAADANHVRAQTLLALIYDLSDENELAVKYYRMAANQGDAEGEFGLAGMYLTGEGVPKDRKEAHVWMRKAAEKGHVQAINSVAQLYITGTATEVTDQTGNDAALKWIQAAANQNYEPAMAALAEAYQKGNLGLAPDPAQAKAWQDKIKALTARGKKDEKKKK